VPQAANAPAGGQRPDGLNHIVYAAASNQHIIEAWLQSGYWYAGDLTLNNL
jgi:hypothetical protein